jgi:hypothetical protein
MDNQRYLSRVFDQMPEGISYGILYRSSQYNTQIHSNIPEKNLNPVRKHYDC